MPGKPIKIKQDGKDYSFTPGAGGSLSAPSNEQPTSWLMKSAPKAKVVMNPDVMKKRQNLSKAIVGMTRG